MRSLLLAVGVASLLAGCGSEEDPAAPQEDAGSVSVAIADFKFGEPVRVAAGGSVEWVNEDSAPHNAVGDDFKTADLEKGDRDSVVFDEPGTYDYVCTFHPFMKGSLVVD